MPDQHQPIGINLLHDRKVEVKRRKIVLAKIQSVTAIVLAVFIGLGILIGGARAASALQVSRLENAISQEEARIAQLKTVESLYTTVTSKFEAYDEINSMRLKVPAVYEKLMAFVPVGVNVNEIGIEQLDALTTKATYTTLSLYEGEALLDAFENEIAEGSVKVIQVNGLNRNETGAYQLTVIFEGL